MRRDMKPCKTKYVGNLSRNGESTFESFLGGAIDRVSVGGLEGRARWLELLCGAK